jgi:uncharacterized coiled-coil DUF342 family protein
LFKAILPGQVKKNNESIAKLRARAKVLNPVITDLKKKRTEALSTVKEFRAFIQAKRAKATREKQEKEEQKTKKSMGGLAS